MPTKKCSLAQAVQFLKDAVADTVSAQGKTWTQRVERAMSVVEQAVRRHRANLKDDEGRVVDVASSLNPSPVVARRADELRDELDALLHEAEMLRQKLLEVHPSEQTMDPNTSAGALSVAPEMAEKADFGIFCERVERLLKGFEHFDREEADLILESVTMDLGAGD